jgi:GT2 family glycosyltransferase
MAPPRIPLVSVIVPNLNGGPYIRECVDSVLSSSYPEFELIFIDDGSTDRSFELVRDSYGKDPRVILLRNERNLGAAAARNRAVLHSNGELLAFLDNDTVVDPSWLDELVRALETSDAGAAQAKVLDYTQRQRIQHAGVRLIPHTAWVVARGANEIDCGQWDSPDEILALTTCLVVRRSSFSEVGGFDDVLAVHSEDVDLSWRMWLAGSRTVLAPSSRIFHRNKTLTERGRMKASDYSISLSLYRNAIRMILKNMSLPRSRCDELS